MRFNYTFNKCCLAVNRALVYNKFMMFVVCTLYIVYGKLPIDIKWFLL